MPRRKHSLQRQTGQQQAERSLQGAVGTTPLMHHKIDVACLFQDALESLPETIDGYPPCKKASTIAVLAKPTNLDAALADLEDSDDLFDKP